jgi:hypothetical protein
LAGVTHAGCITDIASPDELSVTYAFYVDRLRALGFRYERSSTVSPSTGLVGYSFIHPVNCREVVSLDFHDAGAIAENYRKQGRVVVDPPATTRSAVSLRYEIRSTAGSPSCSPAATGPPRPFPPVPTTARPTTTR